MNKQNKSSNLKSIDRIYNSSKILGVSGSQYVKFELKNDDILISQLGVLICMNSGIQKSDLKFDGILKGISKLLAGEPLFYQIFKGNKKNNGYILLGSNFTNSIIVIKIMRGNIYRLSRNSFLASTGNIKISFTFQAKGILGIGQEEGFFLPTATCIGEEYGYIWLCAYGNLEKIEIPKDDYLIVDNGIFLACENKNEYEITKLGKTLFSSLFSGEGFGMKFTGPQEIYIQTKNGNDLIQNTNESNIENNGESIIGNVIDLFNNDE